MPGDESAPTSSVQSVAPTECQLRGVHGRLDELTKLAQQADKRAKVVLDNQLTLHQMQVRLLERVNKFVDPVGLLPRAALILFGAFLGGVVAQALFCAGGTVARLAVLP